MSHTNFSHALKPFKAESGAVAIRSGDLLCRIRNHQAMMAPHQKERTTGKLLIEAADRLEKLEAAWELLVPYMQSEPSSHDVKQAWDNLEAWWKRNAA